MRGVLSLALVAGLFLLCSCKEEKPVSGNENSSISIPSKWQEFKNSSLEKILEDDYDFECSPLENIGCKGLFAPRAAEETQIAVLDSGEDSFATRIHLLESARKSIRIQALIFTGDESGMKISKILKKKKKDGLDVRVIVDSVSNIQGWQTQWMYYDLKQHGIEIEGYEAMWLQWINEISETDPMFVNKRHHEKMWIIDGETDNAIAVAGGLNIANEYFRVDRKHAKNLWRDQDIAVRGALVKDMVTTFERNYQFFKKIKKSRPDIFNTDKAWENWRKWVKAFGTASIKYFTSDEIKKDIEEIVSRRSSPDFRPARARFFQNRPRFKETFVLQLYLDLINAAKKEIIISNAYFIPKRKLRKALRNAVKRGVNVTILTNSYKSNDLPQMTSISRYFYKELMKRNIIEDLKKNGGKMNIYEWEGYRFGEGTLHAKYAVFDRQVSVVGSYNLDPRSELHNNETVVLFMNDELSQKLVDLTRVDLEKSRLIGLAEANHFEAPDDPWKKLELDFSKWLKDWF